MSRSTPTLSALEARVDRQLAKVGMEREIAVTFGIGKSGGSYRGTTGSKVHLISLRYGSAVCNHGRTTHQSAQILKGLDTDAVTCSKCCKRLEELGADIECAEAARA